MFHARNDYLLKGSLTVSMLTALAALTAGLIGFALGWLACRRQARRDIKARNGWWETRLEDERRQVQHMRSEFDALHRNSGWALQRLRADKAELERALGDATRTQSDTEQSVAPLPAQATHATTLEAEAQRLQLALAAMTCRVSESAQRALELEHELQRKTAHLEALEQQLPQRAAQQQQWQADRTQGMAQLQGELDQARDQCTQLRLAYTKLATHSQQEIAALQNELAQLRQQMAVPPVQARVATLPTVIDHTPDARVGELQTLINRLEERLEQMETRYSASLSTIWERDTQLMRARGVIERLARSTGRWRAAPGSLSKH